MHHADPGPEPEDHHWTRREHQDRPHMATSVANPTPRLTIASKVKRVGPTMEKTIYRKDYTTAESTPSPGPGRDEASGYQVEEVCDIRCVDVL
jgi:hypothetical protein